jgi:hypothetical protein
MGPYQLCLPWGDLGKGEFGKEVGIVAGVDDSDHQFIGSVVSERIGDVQLERQVAAFVLPDLPSVEPDGSEVVHRAEVEDVGGRSRSRFPIRLNTRSGRSDRLTA